MKVGEEQSNEEKRFCKPLFCVVNLTDLQIKKAVYRRLKNLVNDRSGPQPKLRSSILSSPNTTAYRSPFGAAMPSIFLQELAMTLHLCPSRQVIPLGRLCAQRAQSPKGASASM
jgi:hypothetical protein